MRIWTGLSMAVVLAGSTVACSSRDQGTTDGGSVTTSGMDSGTSSSGSDAGSSGAVYAKTTVTNAWQNLSQFSGGGVEVDGAIVVAANSYNSTSSKCTTNTKTESFYIQDPTGGAGVEVYHGCTDPGDFPNIGDIVTVKGRLAKFDGSLQISSSTKNNIPLDVKVTQAGGGAGKIAQGAYPPVGTPTDVADPTGYAHSVMDPHPEQLGTALHFGGVAVTDMHPMGFTKTSQDGGSTPEGFEITGGVWVDDSVVYHDCIKPLGLDGGTISLNSVTGMWDRYQDYYGGTAQNPAAVVPVVVPQSCADLGMLEAGTGGTADAGQ